MKKYIKKIFKINLTSILFSFTLTLNSQIPNFEKIINCFANKNDAYEIITVTDQIKLIRYKENNSTLRFFGIHKDDQPKIN